MSYDPVLTAIAVATNDVLTDHLWRHDAAAGDPVADIAVALHRAAYDFTLTARQLTETLHRLRQHCTHHLDTLTCYATLARPHSLDADTLRLLQLLERHEAGRDAVVTAYGAWRKHRPISADPLIRHLLPAPYNPRHGMVTLGADGDSWIVVPDRVAAEAWGLATSGTVIGDIRPHPDGWQPTAYADPAHRAQQPHLVHQLPAAADEATACSSLLRWWAARDRTLWHDGAGATGEHPVLPA
ncbi:hypothetical protein EV384_4646 [Micromonospora kangleipakensis]|uniref:Uncharacterized protein n=1 Tax=Micromonospora kangleipakensis TaxID=1077942 RepID=A0A4Q8BFT3_9ACTN|nr:hypothetical protein [Micromonospora kangleipakensis]RZU76049.1 hypothetical protein EV384_4646 [Micromonospora kangleipakensis]